VHLTVTSIVLDFSTQVRKSYILLKPNKLIIVIFNLNCYEKVKFERGGEQFMGVSAKGERYLCEICGNEVIVEEVGGGTLICCGQEMTLIDDK
jgi:desulfoferrodoxin-like iron-binding protein